MKIKRTKEQYALRVIKGGFIPADSYTFKRLEEKNYVLNDIVFAEIKKPRNPKFHRLAHQLGSLIAENIKSFEGYNAHKVLKRLQLEANIGCEEIAFDLDGYLVIQKIPISLSFQSMDEGEFMEIMRGMARHIAIKYWPSMQPEQIEEMAGLMVKD